MAKENYKAWEIDSRDFPDKQPLEKQIKFLLNYAILAPSALNVQPWLFEISKNILKIKPDFNRTLDKISDKDNRLLYVSIGCVLKNFEIAASAFGFETQHNYINSASSTEVEVLIKPGSTGSKPNEVLKNITNRVTNRSKYSDKEITKEFLAELEQIANKVDFNVRVVEDKKTKEKIIDLVKRVDLEIWSNKDFKNHHVKWVRHNLTTSTDGMPGNTVGVPLIPSFFAKLIFKSRNFANIQSRKNTRLLKSTPYFGFILAQDHTPKTWIKVGEVFEEISLAATGKGLAIAPLAEITEIDDYYKETASILNTKLHPQIFFRLGYPIKPAPHSPRRNVQDFTI